MDAALKTEIVAQLELMGESHQRKALEAIRRVGAGRGPGTPGKDLLDLAGTLTPEEASQMTAVIDTAFERIEADAT